MNNGFCLFFHLYLLLLTSFYVRFSPIGPLFSLLLAFYTIPVIHIKIYQKYNENLLPQSSLYMAWPIHVLTLTLSVIDVGPCSNSLQIFIEVVQFVVKEVTDRTTEKHRTRAVSSVFLTVRVFPDRYLLRLFRVRRFSVK